MRKAGIVVLTAALAALLVAAPAAPRIVPQKGIAGVRLGMTQAEVRAVVGEPLRAVHGINDFGPFTELRYPRLVRVTFQGDVAVTAVSTTGVAERTARGIGVGSTEAALRAKHPRARCDTFVGIRSCHIGRFEPGQTVTDFLLRNGRVARVTVGIVID
jgi:hypothetical protein